MREREEPIPHMYEEVVNRLQGIRVYGNSMLYGSNFQVNSKRRK